MGSRNEGLGAIDAVMQKLASKAEMTQAEAEVYEALQAERRKLTGGPAATPTPADLRAYEKRQRELAFGAEGYEAGEAAEFLRDVILDGTPGAGTSQRLVPWKATAGSDEQSGAFFPYGGALIPESLSPEFRTRGAWGDVTMGKTSLLRMATPVVHVPARVDANHSTSASGGVVLSRRSETTQISSSRVEMMRIRIEAYIQAALVYLTEEYVSATGSAGLDIVLRSFRDEAVAQRNRELIRGTGAGECLGILNSDALIVVPKQTGAPADSLCIEDLAGIRARTWRYEDSVWIVHPTVLPELITLNQNVGVGGIPIFVTDAASPIPNQLLGRPLVVCPEAAVLGDQGDVICAVWPEYIEGVYGSPRVDESQHLRFDYAERALRWLSRWGGAPAWSSVLTPVRGDTLSPYVTLAERS